MSAPFNLPKQTSGKVILLAQVVAKPGKGDETQELLKECRRAAEQDEKETHTYRTTRGTEAEDSADKFVVFEEYTLPNGLNDHIANEPFQALAKAGVLASLDIQYFNEFQ